MGSPIEFGPRLDVVFSSETQATTGKKKKIALRAPDQAQDILEKSSQEILKKLFSTPFLTIGAYASLVEIPKMRHKQKLYENDKNLNDAHDKLLKGKVDTAETIRSVKASIKNIYDREEALSNKQNSEIATLNGLIDAYNSEIIPEDQAKIDTFNTDTQAYNNGEMSYEDYLVAVENYNNYAAARNSVIQTKIDGYSSGVSNFNDQVANNNENIAEINSDSQFNIPDVPNQDPATSQPTYTLPLANTDVPPQTENEDAPQLPNDTRVALNALPPGFVPVERGLFMDTYFKPVYDTLTAGMKIVDRTNDYIIGSEDYRRNYRRGTKGNKKGDADTYVDRQQRQVTSTPNFQRQGGVGLALLSSGGNHLERALSQSQFSSVQELYKLHITEEMLTTINDFALMSLQSSGILATAPAAQALKLEGLSPENAHFSFQVTSGVAVTLQIKDFVGKGASEEAVRTIVQNQIGGKVDQATEDKIVDLLTATLNIALLQIAATSAGVALHAPGLATHLAANVEGVEGGGALTPEEIFADTTRRNFFTATLASAGGVDKSLLDNAVQAGITAGKTTNSSEFRQFLAEHLISKGIDSSKANQLADNALIILNSESIGTRVLDSDLLDRTTSINLLVQELRQQGISDAKSIATKAVTKVLQNGAITNNAEYAAALQIELANHGIDSNKAGTIATNTVAAAAAGEASSLEEPEPKRRLNRRQLRAQLAEHIQQLLANSLGSVEARRHAERVVELLVGVPGGPPSLLDLININVKRLLKASDGKVGGVIQRSFREFISPSIDAFIFNNKLLDPANTFFLTASTSTRLTGTNQPENYIKYLEFYA